MMRNLPHVFEVDWIEDYIRRNGLTLHKMFVDIGAGDGRYCSNSLPFIQKYGWEAVLIDGLEANIEKCKDIHIARPFVKCITAIMSDKEEDVYFEENKSHWSLSQIKQGEPNRRTSLLSKILDALAVKDIGIISIDCEGSEYKVIMDTLLHGIYPQMLIVEGNTFEEMQLHRNLLAEHYKFAGGIFPNQVFCLKSLIEK